MYKVKDSTDKKKEVYCDSCQSEFTIIFKESYVIGPIKHCPYCGEVIDEEIDAEDTSDDINEDLEWPVEDE